MKDKKRFLPLLGITILIFVVFEISYLTDLGHKSKKFLEDYINYINTDMYKEMITVFLPTSQEYIHISSTLVKDALRFHKTVDRYVPEEIKDDIKLLINAEK